PTTATFSHSLHDALPIYVRTPRVTAIFGVVVGALHVFHAGRNGNRAAQMRARPGQALEIGQRVESEIHFSRRTTEFVTLHLIYEDRKSTRLNSSHVSISY